MIDGRRINEANFPCQWGIPTIRVLKPGLELLIADIRGPTVTVKAEMGGGRTVSPLKIWIFIFPPIQKKKTIHFLSVLYHFSPPFRDLLYPRFWFSVLFQVTTKFIHLMATELVCCKALEKPGWGVVLLVVVGRSNPKPSIFSPSCHRTREQCTPNYRWSFCGQCPTS